jgi:hypothetical protein
LVFQFDDSPGGLPHNAEGMARPIMFQASDFVHDGGAASMNTREMARQTNRCRLNSTGGPVKNIQN